MPQWSYSSYGKPRNWSTLVLFLHGVVVVQTCSANPADFSFSLVVGGKWGNAQKPGALLSLASTGQSHHSCAMTAIQHVQTQVGASLCDVLQSPHGNECIVGEEAVKSLLEADGYKSHICLRTNVKNSEKIEADGHGTIHSRPSGR